MTVHRPTGIRLFERWLTIERPMLTRSDSLLLGAGNRNISKHGLTGCRNQLVCVLARREKHFLALCVRISD